MTRSSKDRFRGCLLGLAVGDAVGTTLEFKTAGLVQALQRYGWRGGPFRLKPGEWTDDMSMALCLAASLVEKNGFDPRDQMDRYCRWWREGYLSSTGTCFDIGNTVATALWQYQKTGDPVAGATSLQSAGNGCVMRLAAVPMFYLKDPRRRWSNRSHDTRRSRLHRRLPLFRVFVARRVERTSQGRNSIFPL